MNSGIARPAGIAEFLKAVPRPISSYYWSQAINPTIRLGVVRATLTAGDFSQALPVAASLVCQPSPRIIYQALEPVTTQLFFAAFKHGETVAMPHLLDVPERPRKIAFPAEQFTGRLPRIEMGSGDALDRIRFLVFNFPDVAGRPIRNASAMRASRLVLSSERWTVAMDGVPNLNNRLQQARARGAHVVSHSGELRTADGSSFSSDEAQEVMTALYYLMSFACGARTGPALPVGYVRASRKPSWAQWAVRAIDPYGGTFAWFDKHHPESLGAIFEAFLQRWRDARSRDVLQRIISGFVQAHDPDPIENAIVAVQMALETLTWLIQPGTPTQRGAGGRIAKLLSKADIPLDIPESMPALGAAAAHRGWNHGPHAIVEIRNDIVHVGRNEALDFETLVDAWRLSLWYLELALLRWLGYSGVHNSRIGNNRATGKVEPVPWARAAMPG